MRTKANSKKLVVARAGRMGALLARGRAKSLPKTGAPCTVRLDSGRRRSAALTPGAGARTLGHHVTPCDPRARKSASAPVRAGRGRASAAQPAGATSCSPSSPTFMATSDAAPATPMKFGTSGWRGLSPPTSPSPMLRASRKPSSIPCSIPRATPALGVADTDDSLRRGCVLAHDTRIMGPEFVETAARMLLAHDIPVDRARHGHHA